MTEHYDAALSIIQTLHSQGFVSYFAGGWVRDHLLDVISDDIDIVTDAEVDELRVIFPKTIPVGIQFGIVVVVIGEHQFEVATFRKEAGYEDGRRPTVVKSASPEEDAQRRDFTINGMFYDPSTDEIFDFVGGRADLEKRVIRAIGDPHERFEEDRLRMLRAIRYCCRFQFEIEGQTYKALKSHVGELFPAVAIERVWQELVKMAAFPHFDSALLMLHEAKLLGIIFPSLQSISRRDLERRIHGLELMPKTTPTAAKVSLLFGECSDEELGKTLKEMKIANKEIAFTLFFHRLKRLMRGNKKVSRYEQVSLYADLHFSLSFEILKSLPLEEDIIEYHQHQQIVLADHIDRMREKKPIITAQILTEVGVKPGPQMGEILREAERYSIENNCTDEDELLDAVLPDELKK